MNQKPGLPILIKTPLTSINDVFIQSFKIFEFLTQITKKQNNQVRFSIIFVEINRIVEANNHSYGYRGDLQ